MAKSTNIEEKKVIVYYDKDGIQIDPPYRKQKMTIGNWLTIVLIFIAMLGLFIKQVQDTAANDVRITATEKDIKDNKADSKDDKKEILNLVETMRTENNTAHQILGDKIDKLYIPIK